MNKLTEKQLLIDKIVEAIKIQKVKILRSLTFLLLKTQ